MQVSHCCVHLFSRFSLIQFSMRPVQVFRKPCLIALRRLYVLRLKSAAWRYFASSVFFWDRMLLATASGCCVSRAIHHVNVCLFLVHFFTYCPFFGRKFLARLVWWWIHHHIRLPMILVGLFKFLKKIESSELVLLGLLAGVSLYEMTPLCYHMAALISCHLVLWLWPLL